MFDFEENNTQHNNLAQDDIFQDFVPVNRKKYKFKLLLLFSIGIVGAAIIYLSGASHFKPGTNQCKEDYFHYPTDFIKIHKSKSYGLYFFQMKSPILDNMNQITMEDSGKLTTIAAVVGRGMEEGHDYNHYQYYNDDEDGSLYEEYDNINKNNSNTLNILNEGKEYSNEDKIEKINYPNGVPVLFVPGHGGEYKQGKGLANSLEFMKDKLQNNAKNHFDIYAMDFSFEFSAFHGKLLEQQAYYVAKCINFILERYKHLGYDHSPKSVILVGHSMGGIVSRLAIKYLGMQLINRPLSHSPELNLVENKQIQVDMLITLGSPHIAPPWPIDESVSRVYEDLNDFFITHKNDCLRNLTVLSISGGFADTQVQGELSEFPDDLLPSNRSLFVFTTSIPFVRCDVHHQDLCRCRTLLETLSECLFDLIDSSPSSSFPPSSSSHPFQIHSDPYHRMKIIHSYFMDPVSHHFGICKNYPLSNYLYHHPLIDSPNYFLSSFSNDSDSSSQNGRSIQSSLFDNYQFSNYFNHSSFIKNLLIEDIHKRSGVFYSTSSKPFSHFNWNSFDCYLNDFSPKFFYLFNKNPSSVCWSLKNFYAENSIKKKQFFLISSLQLSSISVKLIKHLPNVNDARNNSSSFENAENYSPGTENSGPSNIIQISIDCVPIQTSHFNGSMISLSNNDLQYFDLISFSIPNLSFDQLLFYNNNNNIFNSFEKEKNNFGANVKSNGSFLPFIMAQLYSVDSENIIISDLPIKNLLIDKPLVHLQLPSVISKHQSITVKIRVPVGISTENQQVLEIQQSDQTQQPILFYPILYQIIETANTCESKFTDVKIKQHKRGEILQYVVNFHQSSPLLSAPHLMLISSPNSIISIEISSGNNWIQIFRSFSRFLLPMMLFLPVIILGRLLDFWLIFGVYLNYFYGFSYVLSILFPPSLICGVLFYLLRSDLNNLLSIDSLSPIPFDKFGLFHDDIFFHSSIPFPSFFISFALICSTGWILALIFIPYISASVFRFPFFPFFFFFFETE